MPFTAKNLFTLINQAFMPMILTVVLSTGILGFIASGSTNLMNFIIAVWLVIAIDFYAKAITNYADWKIDELNNKRVEMHKFLKKNKLLLLGGLLVATTLPFFIFGNLGLQLTLLFSYFLIINYSLGICGKDKLILNYVMISIFYGPTFFLIGFFMGTSDFNLLLQHSWILLFIFLIDMGFSVTKDYEDIKGDKSENKLTLPVVYGKEFSLIYQFVITTVTFGFLALLVLLGWISTIYLILLANYVIALIALYRVKMVDHIKSFHLSHNLIRLNALLIRFMIGGILLLLR